MTQTHFERAAEHRSQSARQYRAHRKTAQDAARFYQIAAQEREAARELTAKARLWDWSNPADREDSARRFTQLGDTYLRSAMRAYEWSVWHRECAEYHEAKHRELVEAYDAQHAEPEPEPEPAHQRCAWCSALLRISELEPMNAGQGMACRNWKNCQKRQWLEAGEAVCAWCGVPVLKMEDGQVVTANDDDEETASACLPEFQHHYAVYPAKDAAGRSDEVRMLCQARGLVPELDRIADLYLTLELEAQRLHPEGATV